MEIFLRKLIDRHPEKGAEILRLAETSEIFRAICEEIELAETARNHWNDMPNRAREYEEILMNLKQEFWKHLSQSIAG